MIALSLTAGLRRATATVSLCVLALAAQAQTATEMPTPTQAPAPLLAPVVSPIPATAPETAPAPEPIVLTPMQQAMAAQVADDRVLQTFYELRQYAPMWVDGSDQEQKRTQDFLEALRLSGDHGLPTGRYGVVSLSREVKSARTDVELARLEARLSTTFLAYARDVQSGILNPASVDRDIDRSAPRRDPLQTLNEFSRSSARAYLRSLPPQTPEYTRLKEEKLRLEAVIASNGWGPRVPDAKLEFGAAGPQVVALRNRLIDMGYAGRSASAKFDSQLKASVASFQSDHGLAPDGVVGKGTLAEINVEPDDRLKSVVVAMERERWLNRPRGDRYIWVNIPDFTARVVDDGHVTFETRAVVGMDQDTRRTPEFSETMEFIVVNPTWNVPRSIATKEYLPMLKKNPNAVSHLKLVDTNGNAIDRASVDFASYSAGNFPFRLKEPPSDGNALGQVKFMFPNSHNIYLHDTPSKSLFSKESRAFSHGCIRLGDPLDFAHVLLATQSDNPDGLMQSRLKTGQESVVTLKQPLPVYLVYFTAFSEAKGRMQFRRDVYGRDARVFDALEQAGVSLVTVEG